jgi:hypothetical protein
LEAAGPVCMTLRPREFRCKLRKCRCTLQLFRYRCFPRKEKTDRKREEDKEVEHKGLEGMNRVPDHRREALLPFHER